MYSPVSFELKPTTDTDFSKKHCLLCAYKGTEIRKSSISDFTLELLSFISGTCLSLHLQNTHVKAGNVYLLHPSSKTRIFVLNLRSTWIAGIVKL